jgi:SAM-dependent methyltransferase
VNAIAGDLAREKASLGTFDVVTFWATIEHLPDPVGILRHIRDVLDPDGRLFLDTGVGADWLDRLLPGVVQWYNPPEYLFVFSVDGMRRALAAADFEVVLVDPCFERTRLRRTVRAVRNAVVAAAALRATAVVGRMRGGEFEFTRYPLGNLMSVMATVPRGAG